MKLFISIFTGTDNPHWEENLLSSCHTVTPKGETKKDLDIEFIVLHYLKGTTFDWFTIV